MSLLKQEGLANISQGQEFELSKFNVPPSEYRPIVFWSWNEKMAPEEVRHQVRLLKQGGQGGGFIHSRVGLLTEYLGDEWFRSVDAAIDESIKQGLKVYLYDEDKWPSGFAGGLVPLKDEKFRLKALVARSAGECVPSYFEPLGSANHGIQIYKWVAPLGHDWFNGTCYADLMSREAMAYFIEQSYTSYYDRYKDSYGEHIIYEFTDEPCTIFRGRLPHGAVPFTDEILNILKDRAYTPLEDLYKLFINDTDSEKFRIDYFRAVNYLFENNFSKQIGNWCREHKIGMTGHYMLEGELYGQQAWGTNVMPNYRHQHSPGIDHLARQIDEIISGKQCQSVVNQFNKPRMLSELYGASGYALSFEDRLWIATQQIQLGANLLNPHLSLYTMAGCRKRDFPPNLFYQQPWWPVNQELDIPLSRLCYAMSKGKYQAKILVIHPQESTFALWQTKHLNCSNDLEGKNLLWDAEPTTQSSIDAIGMIDRSVKELISQLLNKQCLFDFGDETIISQDAKVIQSKGASLINIGQMNYSVVIIPSMHTIAEDTLRLLEEFKKQGGCIFAVEPTPTKLDGQLSERLNKFLAAIEKVKIKNIHNQIKKYCNDIQVTSNSSGLEKIWTHVRQLDDGSKIVLISNLNRSKRFEGSLSVSGICKAVSLLDHWDGQAKSVKFNQDQSGNRTEVSLTLAPTQSRLLLFGNQLADLAVEIIDKTPDKSIELISQDWIVERLDDNALTLDNARWSIRNEALTKKALPVTAIQKMLNEDKYTGKLMLQYEFEVENLKTYDNLRLILEHPEQYSITVNGKKVKCQTSEYWLDIRWSIINISNSVRQGRNTITLICDDFKYGDLTRIDDYAARYGTEIEAIYIKGDFNVKCTIAKEQYDKAYWDKWQIQPDLKFISSDIKIAESSLLQINKVTEQGLPFYAGRVAYKIKLPHFHDNSVDKILLSFEKLNAACAEIFIDEKKVGVLLNEPYSLDIADFYKPDSELKIVLYSSLRNLLGPHHDIDGEIVMVSPDRFEPKFGNDLSFSANMNSWLNGKIKPCSWLEKYCLVNFGNIGRVNIDLFTVPEL